MSAKFKPGDVVRCDRYTEPVTVLACTETLFIFTDGGAEDSGFTSYYELAPAPLPEPYTGYVIGASGTPIVYQLDSLKGITVDVYEVEVRYVRKLNTSRGDA